MTTSTLSPKARAIVAAFGNAPGVTQDHLDNLRAAINASPFLVDQINDAVAQGHLGRIAPLSNPNAGGEYHAATREMRVPLSRLTTPPPGSQQAIRAAADLSEVTFVLGHELQHGFNRTQTQQGYKSFHAQVETVARSGSELRDYSLPIGNLIAHNRRDEAGSQIAGWNAIVSGLSVNDHGPSLKDIYDAHPKRMRDFIDKVGPAPSVYSLKGGLALNADMTMSASPGNIAAMGRHFFDKPPSATGLGALGNSDYANYYGAYAISVISRVDRHHNPRKVSGSPQVGLNLSQLRLSEKVMEENGIDLGKNISPLPYYDLSTKPPAARAFQDTDTTHRHVSPIGADVLEAELACLDQEAPGRVRSGLPPSSASHPDDTLRQKLREQVRALDQQAGKSWDDASERLAASALVMAKESGFTAHDELRLAFNHPTERHAGGEILHLARQGPQASPDPAANRAHMATMDALAVPAEDRLRQVEAMHAQWTQLQSERSAQAPEPNVQPRSGPALQM